MKKIVVATTNNNKVNRLKKLLEALKLSLKLAIIITVMFIIFSLTYNEFLAMMNKETMATLIYRLSKSYSHASKGNSLTEYGRMLLTALYEGNTIVFLQALNLNKQRVSVLEEDEAGTINIYGKKYITVS